MKNSQAAATNEIKVGKSYISKKEYASFGMAGFGQNMIYMTISTYLMAFYTDIALVPIGIVTTMFTIARIWDAVNDPIMGMLVDRVNPSKSKLGKFKPFLLIAPIFITLFTILCFVVPSFGQNELINPATKEWANPNAGNWWYVVYMYITYIGWGMLYTIGDVPFWGLASTVSPDETERTKFISISRTFCTVGSVVPMLAGVVLDAAFGAKVAALTAAGESAISILRTKYLVLALVMALAGGIMFMGVSFGTKERVQVPQVKTTFKDNFKMLRDNKPLLMVLLAGVIGAGRVMAQVGAVYVARYCFFGDLNLFGFIPVAALDDATKTTLLNVGLGAGLFIGTVIAPALQKKFNFKKLYIWSSVIGGILSFITFMLFAIGIWTGNKILAGPEIAIVMLLVSSVSLGLYNVLTYNMVADSIDYLEWKTGERKEGMCFSFQTFMTKFAAGFATLFSGIMLMINFDGQGGFIQPQNGNLIDQTGTTKIVIYAMISLIPAIGSLVAIIPIFYYNYVGAEKDKILAELDVRRKESNSINEDGFDTLAVLKEELEKIEEVTGLKKDVKKDTNSTDVKNEEVGNDVKVEEPIAIAVEEKEVKAEEVKADAAEEATKTEKAEKKPAVKKAAAPKAEAKTDAKESKEVKAEEVKAEDAKEVEIPAKKAVTPKATATKAAPKAAPKTATAKTTPKATTAKPTVKKATTAKTEPKTDDAKSDKGE